jgi:hypothetical protein
MEDIRWEFSIFSFCGQNFFALVFSEIQGNFGKELDKKR